MPLNHLCCGTGHDFGLQNNKLFRRDIGYLNTLVKKLSFGTYLTPGSVEYLDQSESFGISISTVQVLCAFGHRSGGFLAIRLDSFP
jgi:hypothetical protein